MAECSIHQIEENNIQNLTHNSKGLLETNKLTSKTPLPYSLENLHPDDAKDKVFAAILKALVVMDNKPSSPKELANCIMKHKFTILGGATPYATVSSRISQHFKRAAEHKPPRPPLLARVVDEIHSRKIHYYIANNSTPQNSQGTVGTQQQHPSPFKEPNIVEGSYPKLKIRLKKRKKTNVRSSHVLKKHKTRLSESSMGKGKWAPRNGHYKRNDACGTDNSESGSDADIDEIGPNSEQEFNNEVDHRHSIVEKNVTPYDSDYSVDGATLNNAMPNAYDTTKASLDLTSDADYSDYFEEMMNGDLCIDDDSIFVKEEPDSSSSPSFHRFQSDSINSPVYDLPTSASSMVTSSLPTQKDSEMELAQEENLLTPDTTSLFERELDIHLIPSFGDEFNEDSSIISKNTSYVPLMELNNPETMPVSELDELLNGSPRAHDSSPKLLLGSRKKAVTKRVPFHEFDRYEENRDHKVPSREDEIAENDLTPFSIKTEVSKMDVGDRSSDDSPTLSQDGIFEISPVGLQEISTHKEIFAKNTLKGIELLNESCPMLIHTEDKAPMVVTTVYSNVKVYETVLPDTQIRLLRFHSNVSLDSSNHQHKKSMVMLEENRHKDFCNASLLRKAAQPYVGDDKFESDDGNTRFVVIRNGPAECRGVWVSLDRARQLVEEYGIQNVPHIQKLLSDNPLDVRFGFSKTSLDSAEIDNHLVELNGILQDAVAEYSLSEKCHRNGKAIYQDRIDNTVISDPHTGRAELTESDDLNHVDVIDPHTFLSLDEDDEELSQPQVRGNESSHSVVFSPSEGDNETDETMAEEKLFIPTQSPTSPSIYLTVIESVPVYVTYLSKGLGNNETLQLMRRFDSGYVNGTKLLMAGGVETESERTIVLSLEVGRVRVRKPESKLFGTWIPLPRARALASTCSLQHKLGPFLDDNLPTYFQKPLPSSIITARPMRLTSRLHQVLKAKASSLNPRTTIGSSIGVCPQSLHPSKYFSGPNYHIYQILGLQGFKQSKSVALSGIFGAPTVVTSHDDKIGKRWSKKVKSRFVNGKRTTKGFREELIDRSKRHKANILTVGKPVIAKKDTNSDIEVEYMRNTIRTPKPSDSIISS